MTIKYTNDTGISLPMAVWLLNDNYDHISDPDYISATSLLKPVQELVLSRRNRDLDKAIEISSLLKSQLGSALHDAIEASWKKPHIIEKACALLGIPKEISDTIVVNPSDDDIAEIRNAGQIVTPVYMEQRSHKKIGNYTIGGKYDLILAGDLHDYKSTGTFTYIKQSNADKYIQQGSIYRWLNPNKITNDILTINYLFTDWVAYKVNDPGYPQYPAMTQHFQLMSIPETEQFIKNKLALLDKYMEVPDHKLPQCNDKELWRDPPQYKYFKNPTATRATKNFNEDAEGAYAMMRANGCGEVKIVPSTARACNYCSVQDICHQAKELRKSGELI